MSEVIASITVGDETLEISLKGHTYSTVYKEPGALRPALGHHESLRLLLQLHDIMDSR